MDNRPPLAGRSSRIVPLTRVAHRRLRAFRSFVSIWRSAIRSTFRGHQPIRSERIVRQQPRDSWPGRLFRLVGTIAGRFQFGQLRSSVRSVFAAPWRFLTMPNSYRVKRDSRRSNTRLKQMFYLTVSNTCLNMSLWQPKNDAPESKRPN